MSEAVPVPSPSLHRSSQRRLSENEKRAVCSAVLAGATQTQVAHEFDVHLNTVNRLVRNVRTLARERQSPDWRRKLTDQLPAQCVDAIELSVTDTKDIHRAANTATTVLKGLGHLQGETTASVNVFLNSISNLPNDLQDEFVSMGHTIDSQPDDKTTR